MECRSGGTGRRPGLKIPWVVIPVPVRFRSAALDFNLCFWGTEVFCCIFSRNKSAAGTQIRSFSAFSFYIRLFRNLSGRSCDTQIFRISVIRRRKKGMGISLYFLCRGYQTAGADISLHLAHNHLFVSQILFQSNESTVSCWEAYNLPILQMRCNSVRNGLVAFCHSRDKHYLSLHQGFLYIKRNAADHRMAGSAAANQIHTIPICLNGL